MTETNDLVLGTVLAWDGDSLRADLSHPVVKRALDRPALSPSSSNAIASCPSRWAIEKLQPEVSDPFGAAELGTSGHALLEDVYGQPSHLRTRSHAAALLDELHVRHPELVTPENELEMGLWRSNIAEKVFRLWDIEDPAQITPTGLELRILTEISGVPFKGVIDRLDQFDAPNGDQKLRVVDYKTGKFKPERKKSIYPDDNAVQQQTYALAVQARYGIAPAEAYLHFTAHGQTRRIDLSKTALDKASAQLQTSWATIRQIVDTGVIPTKESALCGWCPLVELCPTAKAAGRVDRSDVAKYGHAMQIPVLDAPAPTEPTPAQACPPPDTHIPAAPNPQPIGAPTMNNGPFPFPAGGKSWDETMPGGALNATSYSAGAAFGITGLAVKTLHQNGQPMNRLSVTRMALVLSSAAARVQMKLQGTVSLQEGLHTRIRGAIHTAMETLDAPPFDGSDQAWQVWFDGLTNRASAICFVAHDVWTMPDVERPWAFEFAPVAQTA